MLQDLLLSHPFSFFIKIEPSLKSWNMSRMNLCWPSKQYYDLKAFIKGTGVQGIKWNSLNTKKYFSHLHIFSIFYMHNIAQNGASEHTHTHTHWDFPQRAYC